MNEQWFGLNFLKMSCFSYVAMLGGRKAFNKSEVLQTE